MWSFTFQQILDPSAWDYKPESVGRVKKRKRAF